MFVQSVDNLLYENPIIEGDGFFIRFQELELPEIVIRYSINSTMASSRDLAYKRFRELDMKVQIINGNYEGDEDMFAFPPDWRGMVRGCKWEFELLDKIPIPSGYKSKVDYPCSDVRFIAWELKFPMKEVIDYMDKKAYNSILLSFMAGKEIFPPIDKKTDRLIRKAVEMQLKNYNIINGNECILLTKPS